VPLPVAPGDAILIVRGTPVRIELFATFAAGVFKRDDRARNGLDQTAQQMTRTRADPQRTGPDESEADCRRDREQSEYPTRTEALRQPAITRSFCPYRAGS
jgi:hypothetical protein